MTVPRPARLDHEVGLARADEFAALREIERAAEAQFSHEDLPPALRGNTLTSDAEFAEALEQGLLWSARDSVGAALGFAIALWVGEDLHLDELDVHPAHQRRGIGRALVDAVRAHGQRRGARRLTLTTFRLVAWNMPWYERLGFVALAHREMTPGLRAIFEDEIARGLARERRVAMSLELGR